MAKVAPESPTPEADHKPSESGTEPDLGPIIAWSTSKEVVPLIEDLSTSKEVVPVIEDLDLSKQEVVAPNAALPGGSADKYMVKKEGETTEESGAEVGAPAEATAVQGPHFGYRPDVDGLRALAVTAVVVFHLNEAWLPGGFTGVDIFFVLSGYVVSGSLLHRVADTNWIFFGDFYCRRLKRLTPSLLCMIFFASLFTAIFVPPWFVKSGDFFWTAQLGLVGGSNFYFALNNAAAGYFTVSDVVGPQANPFTHTWSLAVEEQFYLMFPGLLLLGHGAAISKTCPFSRSAIRSLVLLLGSIVLTLVLSALMSEGRLNMLSPADTEGANAKREAFYMIYSRFWEMAAGAVLMDVMHTFPERYMALVNCRPLVLGLEVVCLALFTYGIGWAEHDPFPVPFALPCILGTLIFLLTGASQHGLLKQVFGHAAPVYIGKLSYPIYLWHWPVIVIWKWVVGPLDWWQQILSQLMTLAVSMATYHLLEQRVCLPWKPERWMLALLFLSLIAAMEGWLTLLQGPLNGQLYYIKYEKAPYPTITPNNTKCECSQNNNTLWQPSNSTNETTPFGSCFSENSLPFESAAEANECHFHGIPTASELAVCIPARQNNLYLIGDSHAGHFKVGFLAAASTVRNASGASLSSGSPARVREQIYEPFLKGQLVAGDVVVLAIRWANFAVSSDYLALEELVSSIVAQGVRVVLFSVGLEFPQSGLDCTISWNERACDTTLTLNSDQLWEQALTSLASTSNDVYLWEYRHLFCSESGFCDPWVPGTNTLAFYDTNHMTIEGSLYLWPYMCSFFRSNEII